MVKFESNARESGRVQCGQIMLVKSNGEHTGRVCLKGGLPLATKLQSTLFAFFHQNCFIPKTIFTDALRNLFSDSANGN